MSSYSFYRGSSQPFGVFRQGTVTNFSLFVQKSNKVTLCLFKSKEPSPFLEVPMFVTGQMWHVAIADLPSIFEYGYHIDEDGPLIIDPFSRGLTTSYTWEADPEYFRSIFQEAPFDWGEDRPPNHSLTDLIIYEMHIRGFTQDKSSEVKEPGKFISIIEKIPHLKNLGINAVEFLPIFEFNEKEYRRKNPENNKILCNYWGYSTINYFTPMNRYGVNKTLIEFKELVKELHHNSIEVILDVVYNHTSEGGKGNFSQSFRALGEETYYMINKHGDYLDFTGCGNSFNANHPLVIEFIIQSLRYWVEECHVDGFRFDLASTLTRNSEGIPQAQAPLIEAISKDPILANIKLIAEPWDIGLYQVGHFGNDTRWIEWNDKYRDDMRRFLKGSNGDSGRFAERICGSMNVYGTHQQPLKSLNFITCHDGFSLHDLVSYNVKHNLANGEDNKDGFNNNNSWNCGIEGPTDNPEVLVLRQRQMRNFHLALMISQGIPMIHMGDEYAHTRKGNNNPWCQDNELNWFLWNKLQQEKDFYRFFRLALQLRKNNPLLRRSKFLTPEDIDWHGSIPYQANWGEENRLVAFTLKDLENKNDLYIAFNAHPHSVLLHLPQRKDIKHWRLLVNTAAVPPSDIFEEEQSAPCIIRSVLKVSHHSAILLKAI